MAAESVINKAHTQWIRTPKCEIQWCMYVKPDDYGKYSVDMYFNEEDTEKFVTALELMRDLGADDATSAGKQIKVMKDVYKMKNGKICFQATVDATKAPNGIPIYNRNAELMPGFNKAIANGSTAKIQVRINPYYVAASKTVGVKLTLLEIMLIDLIEYKADEGFDPEDTDNTPPQAAQAKDKVVQKTVKESKAIDAFAAFGDDF